jgi:hypothetical protein
MKLEIKIEDVRKLINKYCPEHSAEHLEPGTPCVYLRQGGARKSDYV